MWHDTDVTWVFTLVLLFSGGDPEFGRRLEIRVVAQSERACENVQTVIRKQLGFAQYEMTPCRPAS